MKTTLYPYSLLILLFFSGHFCGLAQDEINTDNLIFYNGENFHLQGSVIPDSMKEAPFDRLPLKAKGRVHPHVWYLSKTSAGLSLHFRSNSSTIAAKWEALRDEERNHMAGTAVKGLDLYCKTDNSWRYVNTAKPSSKISEYLLVENAADTMREYMLYLPLYDGIKSVEIGIDSTSVIENVVPENTGKPIVFYGTSITQGGCASRPGMVYTNIISRELNVECINLGFAGNGRMEPGVAEIIAEMDASLYVIDCIGNMSVEQISQNVKPLVRIIREKSSDTPIVFIENLMFERAFLNDSLRNSIQRKNKTLKAEYVSLAANGKEDNLFYIGVKNALGSDHEGTVDGIHLTDLGFQRFSDYLISEFRRLGLIN